ncbi:hypothetical protein Hdeb2414_s0001g00042341 [Helianthus debilis subsp. tardiflorus]
MPSLLYSDTNNNYWNQINMLQFYVYINHISYGPETLLSHEERYLEIRYSEAKTTNRHQSS